MNSRKRCAAILTIVSCVTFASVAVANEEVIKERTLLGGKLTLLAPESFQLMNDEMLRLKYPSEQRPTTVLTNPEGSVNIALRLTDNAVEPEQLAEVHKGMDRMFRNRFPSAKWSRSEIVMIHGREFFVLDLRTPAMDTKVRNIMTGTSFEGRLLLITFNCTQELEGKWAALGRRMVDSAKLAP